MGSISKNFGSSDAYTITLKWEEVSQSVTNNQTKLKFTCTLKSNRSSATFTGQAKTDTLKVGGTSYSIKHSAYTLNGSSTITLWTKTLTVTHGSDGTYSGSVSAAVMIGTTFSSSGYIGTVTASGTLKCTTIARSSTLAFGAVILGSKVSMDIYSESSSFTHTITYSIGSKTGTIVSKTSKTEITWTPSLDLAAEITNNNEAPCILKITTYSGSTNIGSEEYETIAQVPSSLGVSVSSGWATVSYYNTGTAASSIEAFVQGYSKAQVTFDTSKITTYQGATIKSYKISCNGKTVTSSPYRTDTLSDTSATITCTVTDSRGFSKSTKLSVTVLPYSRPKLKKCSLYRGNSSGTANDAGTCICAKATLTYSSIDGLNSCSLKGYYRLQSDSYSSSVNMTSGTMKTLTSSAPATSTYVAKIVAKDSLGNTATYEAVIPTAAVALHLRPGGTGVGLGKYSEIENAVEIADDWDLVLHGSPVVDHIIERGSSGNWEYVYYASGYKEAWYKETFENVEFSATGNVYRSAPFVIDPPPSPNSSVSVSFIMVDGYGSSYNAWFGQCMYDGSNNPDKISVRAFSGVSTSQNVRVRIYIRYR